MAHAYNQIQLSSFLDQVLRRNRVVEAHLAMTTEQLEIPHQDAASMTPAEVVELLLRAESAPRNQAMRPGPGGPASGVPATSHHAPRSDSAERRPECRPR
jgi:hypothetical protein